MTRAFRGHSRGAASAEWLVVAPAILALGFGVLQWALLLHGRASVEYAAFQGARAGATRHADPAAIVEGLAIGLVPIRDASMASVPVSASQGPALALLGEELASGVAAWRQQRPAPEDFADWAVPARDDEGRELAGVLEIPNDNLRYRGSARGGRSGRSLVESNLLEIEFIYAWPMRAPLIGSLAVRWMEWLDGCAGAAAPTPGYSPWGRADWRIEGGAWRCPYYRAGGVPRWPLRVVASARMHSPARHAGASAGGVARAGIAITGPTTAGDDPAVGSAANPGVDEEGAMGEGNSEAVAEGGGPGEAGPPPIAGPATEAVAVSARADISQPGECFAEPGSAGVGAAPVAGEGASAQAEAPGASVQPEMDVRDEEAPLAAAVESLAAETVAVQAR